MIFQPTLPLRGETKETGTFRGEVVFQPTLPLRGETKETGIFSSEVIFLPTLLIRHLTITCIGSKQ